uniref:SRCR domain-containing protein n=1 Tax=Globodera pallida TaxID=36090 RepID=A0A183BNB4_GLOPA
MPKMFYGAFKNSLLAWESQCILESGDVSIKQGCSNSMSYEQLRFNCEQQEGGHFASHSPLLSPHIDLPELLPPPPNWRSRSTRLAFVV